MPSVKRYAGAAAVALVVLALLFHGNRAEHAIVQTDPPAAHFQTSLRPSLDRQIVVYVAGAVVRPGLYRLVPGARGIDAIRAAGGLTSGADPAGVNLAEQLEDGEQITAPRTGERLSTYRTRARRRAHRRHKRGALTAPAIAPADLNSADLETLMQLPGIGEELARRIIAFREANGPFVSLDELADVAGMTPRLIDALTPYLTLTR